MPPNPKNPIARATWLRMLIALASGLAVASAEQVEDTKLSVDRGFFEAPFLVEITSATPGAQIRFTTDGSLPTLANGQSYTTPLVVNRTTVLRSAAFKDGLDPTDVDTHSYIFLDDVIRQTGAGMPADWGELGNFDTEPGNLPPGPYAGDYAMDPEVVDHAAYSATIEDDLRAIPILSVSLHPDDLFSSEVVATDGEGDVVETRGIYPIGKGFERAASAELILPDGASAFQIDCSVEIQGATSTDRWKTDKLSMRLKFKSPYGPSELDYPLFGDDATDSINTVILDATNQQAWTHPDPIQQPRAQYIRDQFVGDLQNAAGGIAPHGRYAHVYLNGLYWGVYWLHEFVDEAFTVAYRGGEESDYDVLRHRADNVVAGDAESFAALLDAVEEDLAVPANYESVTDKLDLAAFADYILVNFYAGNADWAFQNWNASAHRTDPARKWQFHNWDAEKTFQFASDDVTDADDPGSPTHIHQRLRTSAEYRLTFADRVHRHLFNGGLLTPATASAMYLDRLSQIDRAIVGESARWGDNRNPGSPPYTRETWLAERDRLLNDFFPVRTANLFGQLQADGLYPPLAAPVFNQHGGEVTAGFVLNITNPSGGGQVYFTDDGTDPRAPGGGVSGTAIAGTSRTINTSARVMARVRSAGGGWSALNDAVFFVPGALSDLRVTELMFNPAPPSAAEELAGFTDADEFEFIELRNTGGAAIDLAGITFTSGIQFTFPGGRLAPGDRIVAVNDQAAFEERYGAGVATIAGEFGGSLGNGGEKIAIAGPFGGEIQTFTYDDKWHPATDGGGHSLVTVDDAAPLAAWDTAAGWRPSSFVGGAPGTADTALPSVRITELHYDPGHPDPVESGAGFEDEGAFEFVEVCNTGLSPINLSGFELSEAVDFTFGALVLGAGDYAVVVADASAFAQRYGGGITIAGEFSDGTLSDSGERVVLKGGGGEVIHDFDYSDDWYPETDGGGASLVIVDELAPQHLWGEMAGWRASSQRHGSPGAADPPANTSPLRISELMFNPADPSTAEQGAGYSDNDDFEFVELVNTSGGILNLNGYQLMGAVTYTFGNVFLDPGERVVLVKDEDAFRERYGTDDPVVDEYGGNFNNDFEEVRLLDPSGGVVLQFTYDGGWHDPTDGEGRSLTLIDPLAHPATWGEKDSWRPSGGVGGTPGLEGDPYSAWVWQEFSDDEALDAAISGPMVDAECDGAINLIEFALATDPNKAGGAGYFITAIEIDGAWYLAITYRVNPLSDAVIDVQFSTDGASWMSADPQFETYINDVAADGTPRVTVIDSEPMTAPGGRLVRLGISR